MKTKTRDLFVKVLVVALVSAAVAIGASAQTVADVDAVVQKAIDAKNIPAAGVAVVRDGKVILAKGYGAADIESATAANENTAFQIASVTKQFTAAGILLLVEDGKLKLDDTLGKYVPDAPQKWSGITIRQLLNQVSGIPNYTAGGKLVNDKVYTKAEILGLVRDVPPSFDAGTRWEYSNTNYFLLGMVIEKVSGKAYPDYMQERIFKPLGMSSTFVNTSGLKIKNAATGYNFAAGKWEKAINKLNELVKQLPENAMLYAARGDAYSALEDFEKALTDYDAVIRLEPENGKARNIRANLYRDMERNDEALADFTEAIRLEPDHAFPHVSRGMLYYLQGKTDEALKDFEIYSELAPEDYMGHNNKAFIMFQLGRYEEAEAAWRKASELEDADDYVFAGHAVALEQLQRPAEALEEYRKAVQMNRRWKNKLDHIGAEYSWTEPMLVLATHIIGRLRAAR